MCADKVTGMAKSKYTIPRALSAGEEAFWRDCRVVGLSPEREYPFCEGRKWAFDFAFPDDLIAVEVEGGTAYGKSRHSRGQGFVNDCLKYNMAARLGWRVLRYTTEMVVSGHAIDDIQQILETAAKTV